MKIVLSIVLILFLPIQSARGQAVELYPIRHNNKIGFIDQTGRTVIQPAFYSAGRFSEGLAPARLNGTYGYINSTGNYVIAPRYDIAYPFHNGIAEAVLDGTHCFIDTKGTLLFTHSYKRVSAFTANGTAIVETASRKYGLIRKSGKLILDTVYSDISKFESGVAVVRGARSAKKTGNAKAIKTDGTGVIDTHGKWVVPFGRYQGIDSFNNGYAVVTGNANTHSNKKQYHGVIDSCGTYRFSIDDDKWEFKYQNPDFRDGIAVIRIFTSSYDTVKRKTYPRDTYMGIINTKGEILYSNPDWKDLTPFSVNRAFAKMKDGKWYLVNRKGQYVSDQPSLRIDFDARSEVQPHHFYNGLALIQTDSGYSMIDTSGKKVVTTIRSKREMWDCIFYRFGDLLLYQDEVGNQNTGFEYRYGFWNTRTNTVVDQNYTFMEVPEVGTSLIYAVRGDTALYISHNGDEVWKEQISELEQSLNIDFMMRGYFYAASEDKKHLAGFGGWGKSDNSSSIIPDLSCSRTNTFTVHIDTMQRTRYWKNFGAVKLYVMNGGGDTLYFPAQDSRLEMILQAKDTKGKWSDIEYLPSSWCGHSYHTLFLAPQEQWEFIMPRYQGEITTKIRARLAYKRTQGAEKKEEIFSNEIDGSINPGQFWNKRPYNPSGIMDPYND